MTTRDHSIEEAAELLGCRLRWLQDNYKRFEHQGYGKAVSFTDAQLDMIRAACAVRGTDSQPPGTDSQRSAAVGPNGRIPITELRPRRRARVS